AEEDVREGRGSIFPLLDAVIEHIPPPPVGSAAGEAPSLMVTMLDYDDYIGRIAIGRVRRGRLSAGRTVAYGRPGSPLKTARIEGLFVFERLERVAAAEAGAGEIVALTGIEDLEIGDTVTDLDNPELLPPLAVDEPTLRVVFRVNDSPLAGTEGKYLTSRHLRDRLFREARTNVALRVEETDEPDAFLVAGRGELHLGIWIETMRREGYEFAVSKPEVVFKEVDGALPEPMERVVIEAPQAYLGPTVEKLGARKGEMVDM